MPNNNDIQLDRVFAALADPTRRAVMQRLAKTPNASVSELHSSHDMALPSFTQHLGVLEAAGLISSHKRGRVRMVNIEAQPLKDIQYWLDQQRQLWESRFDRLDAFALALENAHKKGHADEQ